MIVGCSLEEPQGFQQRKLGEVEEVDLVCGQSRVLEMTGRAEMTLLKTLFGMKKIDEKREREEDQQEQQVEEDSFFYQHP